MALEVTGFDCAFVEKPPEFFQTSCPICLLILREPHQVTCCGKSFCRTCIQKIKTKKNPCPTCNKENFTDFPNLGLQQPLYGFKVHCSNKDEGCDWQGELGQLDKHLNLNPDKDKQETGCAYTKVKCLHCSELYLRCLIKHHQALECLLRPFSCEMCKEFKSTYDDVTTNHAPSCKCRPVECPNRCGNTLQHQKLKDHVSNICPLSMVDCEFTGCEIKMHRKDLPSHLSESVVTHLSLLARTYGEKIAMLERENENLKLELQNQARITKSFLPHFYEPPFDITCVKRSTGWVSEPFYSHGGYKLLFTLKTNNFGNSENSYFFCFDVLNSEYKVKTPCTLSITAEIVDQLEGKANIARAFEVCYPSVTGKTCTLNLTGKKYLKNDRFIVKVTNITSP